MHVIELSAIIPPRKHRYRAHIVLNNGNEFCCPVRTVKGRRFLFAYLRNDKDWQVFTARQIKSIRLRPSNQPEGAE